MDLPTYVESGPTQLKGQAREGGGHEGGLWGTSKGAKLTTAYAHHTSLPYLGTV